MRQVFLQPGARRGPVTLHGARRNTQCFGRLFLVVTGEIPTLHDFGQARVASGKPVEGLMHGQDGLIVFHREILRLLQRHYPGAMLTTGFVNPDGTASVDLAHPLARLGPFVSRDYQFTPLYFDDPIKLGRQVSNRIARGEIENLFFVLQIPSAPFPGPSNLPPLLGESCSSVRESNFYFSVDGKTFAQEPFCNLKFALIVAEPGTH